MFSFKNKHVTLKWFLILILLFVILFLLYKLYEFYNNEKNIKTKVTNEYFYHQSSNEEWKNWDSDLSVNYLNLNVPWVTRGINPAFNTELQKGNLNLFPFKVVTAQYLYDKGYLSTADYIWSGSRGQNIFMYSVNVPSASKWVPVADLFIASRNNPDLNRIPVVLVRNSKPFSVPMRPKDYKWISDSWKCRNPDQLGWWGYQSTPDSNYNAVGALISRFDKGKNPLDVSQRGNKACVIAAVNKKYLNQIGANDQDGRWVIGNDSGSKCGKDHWFYMTSVFFTMGVNSNNSGWWFGNRPFYDFIPDSSVKVNWFNVLLESNPSLKQYYKMEGPNNISLHTEYGGDILGTIVEEDPTSVIKMDGKKVDLREVIALFGHPPQSTANWFNEFANTNEGAKKIKDRFLVENRKLYILPENKDLFTLSNQQTGRCVHPEGGSPTPGEDTKLVFHSDNCGDNPPPDKLVMYQDNNGILHLKNGACVAAYYNGNANGQPLNYTYQWCDQPFDFLPNGALRHRASGRCVHPQGGTANQGTRLVTWDDCNAGPRIQFNKKMIPKAEKQYIGTLDDAHIGEIRTEDGTWIPIGDIFQLIAGPRETFRFTYMNQSERIDQFNDYIDICKNLNKNDRTNFIIQNKEFFRYVCWPWERCAWSWAEDIGNKIASGTMTAADWVKNRAEDVANFAKNAAIDVGSWAKNISGDALNWAKGAGSFVVKNLVDIGTKIGSFARDAANKIKDTANSTVNTIKTNVYDKGLKVAGNAIADASVTAAMAVKNAAEQGINFLASFPEIARQAVNKAIDWLKGAADKVWDAIKTPIGMIINIVLEGTHCEYKVQRDVSRLEAIRAIQPALLPKLRIVVLQFVKSILNAASGGILTPVLALIMPFVEPYIAPHLDGLLAKAIETNEASIAITTMADPIVNEVSKISCQFLNPPDISDITFSMPDNIEITDSDLSQFDDL
jgi:hypothetical protein